MSAAMEQYYDAYVKRLESLEKEFQKYANKCAECDELPGLYIIPNCFAPKNIAVGFVAQCPKCGKRIRWEATYEELEFAISDTAFLKSMGEKWNEQNE